MIYEKEVISIPASGTIDIIYKYAIHAHPIQDKGYNYKFSRYYTFRGEHGVMEKLFSLEKSIILNVDEMSSLDSEEISKEHKERLINYIKARNESFGFDNKPYKFYILKEECELKNKPTLPKRNNHSYFTLSELEDWNDRELINQKDKKKTFLLTFNPTKWKWDNINECILELKEQGRYVESWSCGNCKKIKRGDRVFLIKLGKEPKGIFASGIAYDGVYKAPHWDESKRNNGELANFISVDFDVLINSNDSDIMPLNKLREISPRFAWTSQISGIEIPGSLAEKLELIWCDFAGSRYKSIKRNELGTEEILHSERYYEGAVTKVAVNKYERNSKARDICIKEYGYICSICGVNLEEIYGELGKEFIHVHHTVPLNVIGEEYEINPVNDLRPVCPNCHSIIHRRNPAYSIEEIKKYLNNG
jgi:5-methylcytosine-specific restriction protein A